MLENPVFWVAVSFVGFLGIAVYLKLHVKFLGLLDDRAVKIKNELDAARILREEAEAVLAEYKQKQAQYLREAEVLLAKAKTDAENLRTQSEKELKQALDVQMQASLDRIAQEEQKAVQDVRNHIVSIALEAARSVITKHGASSPDLLKSALADIDRKLH